MISSLRRGSTRFLAACLLLPAHAFAISLLWYSYAAPDSEYRTFYASLAKSQGWNITFFGPGSSMPDFGSYNALVIESGEAFRTNPPGGPYATPDYSGILGDNSEIAAARGDRTFISGSDADFHAVRGDSGYCTGPLVNGYHCGLFDGARGYLINAVDWAASGSGLGVVSFFDGAFPGSFWWDNPNSFLRNDLYGYVANVYTNDALIQGAAAAYSLNQGLTSTGLSNWNNSFHAMFSPTIPGYSPTVYSGTTPGYALSIASDIQEPENVLLMMIGLAALFFVRRRHMNGKARAASRS